MTHELIASPAERRVAELVLKGLSNKQVATRLGLTLQTVKFHMTMVYKKNKVKSRLQLAIKCGSVK